MTAAVIIFRPSKVDYDDDGNDKILYHKNCVLQLKTKVSSYQINLLVSDYI